MPPRYSYWTILIDGAPTAFRASKRDDLVPTVRQLQSKHVTVALMWFARGRLWHSPDDARAHRPLSRRRPRGPGTEQTRRGPDWRPGGKHRDPRARVAKHSGRQRGKAKRSRGR